MYDRDSQILYYMPSVRRTAFKFARNLPANFEVDDLVSVGYVQLVEIFSLPDISHISRGYVALRVWGAMIDYLRQQDWVPRTAKIRIKAEEIVTGQPSHERAVAQPFISIDDLVKNDGGRRRNAWEMLPHHGVNPEDDLAQRQVNQCTADFIQALPEKYRTVVRMYYEQELTLQQIGDKIGVTESRVSQMLTEVTQNRRSLPERKRLARAIDQPCP